MSKTEHLPPNFQKLDVALRSIGYSFETAVADVIDNSIDASADRVLVRLVMNPAGRLDLAIWDNGTGMSSDTLRQALFFGADITSDLKRLGKFRLGLKLASLSQARDLQVISFVNGVASGRAWLAEGISSGFTSTVFDTKECLGLHRSVLPDHARPTHGTLVLWSHLYRVGQQRTKPQAHAQALLRRLESSLALSFHRFLAGRPRKVQITLDIFDRTLGNAGVPFELDALDPFGYDTTGHGDFPVQLFAPAPYRDAVTLKAHIWPPHSSSPGYKLPGGANSRQGFYFYRNNRLIQGGGWNGIREPEPHFSLARLEVDLSPDLDIDVSLDVKKIEIQLPEALLGAIQKSTSANGIDFKKYQKLAERSYRTKSVLVSDLPLIPATGLPAPLTAFLRGTLRHARTAKHRKLRIEWRRLEPDRFFDIDRDDDVLMLNKLYRTQLLHGLPGSAADAPVVKCLLFLLLEDALASERLGSRQKERLDLANQVLVKAVRYERLPT